MVRWSVRCLCASCKIVVRRSTEYVADDTTYNVDLTNYYTCIHLYIERLLMMTAMPGEVLYINNSIGQSYMDAR